MKAVKSFFSNFNKYFNNLMRFPMKLVNFGNFDNDGLITFTMSSNFTKLEILRTKNHISN